MPKNDGIFNVRFNITNLALKMPKWGTKIDTKMPKLVKCCLNLFPINWCFKHQNNILGTFMQIKNVGIKAFIKLP